MNEPTLDDREFHARQGVCLCITEDANGFLIFAVVMLIAG